MEELEIKTKCKSGKSWLGTKDDLVFTLCQNQQCCSTGPIGLPNGYSDCLKTDNYNLSELGDCAKVDFVWQNIQGNLTFYENIGGSHDGWRGDWFNLIYDNDTNILCKITTGIGFKNKPESLNFSCSP